MIPGLTDGAAALAIAFARIAGCFLVLPGFASVRVPAQVRILLVMALSVALLPLVWDQTVGAPVRGPAGLTALIFAETVKGAFIGLVVRFYMLALSFIISAASTAIGFNAPFGVSVIEPDVDSALGALVALTALVMIFALDFHHDVVRALIDSYGILPVGEALPSATVLADLTRTLSDSFFIVLRLGSPFIAYALLANLFVALLNKLTPSLPVYFITTPVIIIGGLILAYFILPAMLSLFAGGLSEMQVFR